MDKQEIFDYLDEKNIWHEITEHEAVFSMEEAISVDLPYPQCDAKNLFIRDDKKRNYYMVDHADFLLAVYDNNRKLRSGTGQTVNYALKQNLRIIFLHPDTAEIS